MRSFAEGVQNHAVRRDRVKAPVALEETRVWVYISGVDEQIAKSNPTRHERDPRERITVEVGTELCNGLAASEPNLTNNAVHVECCGFVEASDDL